MVSISFFLNAFVVKDSAKIYAGTREFFDNLALASQFLAEHKSTGVLEALSKVWSRFNSHSLVKIRPCLRLYLCEDLC